MKNSSLGSLAYKCKCLLLASMLTVAPFSMLLTDQYEIAEPQLLENAGFNDGLHSWEKSRASNVNVSNGVLSLENTSSPNQSLSQRIEVEGPGVFRFSLQGATGFLVNQDVPWAGASATVGTYDLDGNFIRKQTVFVLKGADHWRLYHHTEHFGKEVSEFLVTVRLLRTKGVFHVKNLTVSLLDETDLYKFLRVVILICWGVAGLFIVAKLFYTLSLSESLTFSGLGAMGFLGLVLPGSLLSPVNEIYNTVFNVHIGPLHRWMLEYGVGSSDLSHFLLFFVIGLLFGAKSKRWGVLFTLSLIVMLAFFTESLQIFVNGRSTSPRDFAVDLLGGFFGFVIVLALKRLGAWSFHLSWTAR